MYQIAGMILAAMMGMTAVSEPTVVTSQVYSVEPAQAVVSTQTVSSSGFSDDYHVSVESDSDGPITIYVVDADGTGVQAYTTDSSGAHEFKDADGNTIGTVTIHTTDGEDSNIVISNAVTFGDKKEAKFEIREPEYGGQLDPEDEMNWADEVEDAHEAAATYGGQLNPEDDVDWYEGSYSDEYEMPEWTSSKRSRYGKSRRGLTRDELSDAYAAAGEAQEAELAQSKMASDTWPKADVAEDVPETQTEQGGMRSFLTGKIAAIQVDGQVQEAANPFLGYWRLKDDDSIIYEFMPDGQLMAQYGGQQMQMAYAIDGEKLIMHDGNECIVANYVISGDEMDLSAITIYDERGVRPSAATDALVRMPESVGTCEDQPLLMNNEFIGMWQNEDGVMIGFDLSGGVKINRGDANILQGMYAKLGNEIMMLNNLDDSVHRFVAETWGDDQLYMHERVFDEAQGKSALLEPVAFSKAAE